MKVLHIPQADVQRLAVLSDLIVAGGAAAGSPSRCTRRGSSQPALSTAILQVDSDGYAITDRFELFRRAWSINTDFQNHAASAWAVPHCGTHHFSWVKDVHRVYQKVNRAYRGSLARVLDIVRTTITFTDLQHLTDCLGSIASDPQFSIVRLKNRYAHDFNSVCGYRDVSLLVASPELTNGFVCEVQLNLESMFRAKTEGGGHHRYTLARDARGD
jgi:hypothetical protein